VPSQGNVSRLHEQKKDVRCKINKLAPGNTSTQPIVGNMVAVVKIIAVHGMVGTIGRTRDAQSPPRSTNMERLLSRIITQIGTVTQICGVAP
jgi:hypothetical protein